MDKNLTNTNLIESRSQFSFKLEGENEVDASLLAKTIGDIAELAKLAANTEDPEAYIKMNVTAFKNGSFQIDFSAICEAAKTLFDKADKIAAFALSVVGVVKGIFEIKKFLKGKKPKAIKDESTKIISVEDDAGNKITVPRSSAIVINNVRADQLTINIASYMQEHNPNGGFTISTEQGDLRCEPEDVKQISKAVAY